MEHLVRLLLAAGLAAWPLATAAEENTNDADGWAIDFSIGGGFEHQFETDLDGDNGEFDLTRFDLGLGAGTQFTDALRLDLNFGYGYEGYDFSGDAGFGAADPWDNINTFRFGARLTWSINKQWAIFGGPIFGFSAESGADLGDAFTAGGIVGVRYSASENFTIGLGVGVQTQIEDSAAVFPIVILNWHPTDTITVSTVGSVGSSGGGGVEVGWMFAEGWTLSAGVQYRSSRFRLDNNVPAARNGVGEHTSLPIYGKLAWNPSAQAEVSVMGGVVAGGELRLEDDDGDKLREEDYDLAPFIGLRFSLRF